MSDKDICSITADFDIPSDDDAINEQIGLKETISEVLLQDLDLELEEPMATDPCTDQQVQEGELVKESTSNVAARESKSASLCGQQQAEEAKLDKLSSEEISGLEDVTTKGDERVDESLVVTSDDSSSSTDENRNDTILKVNVIEGDSNASKAEKQNEGAVEEDLILTLTEVYSSASKDAEQTEAAVEEDVTVVKGDEQIETTMEENVSVTTGEFSVLKDGKQSRATVEENAIVAKDDSGAYEAEEHMEKATQEDVISNTNEIIQSPDQTLEEKTTESEGNMQNCLVVLEDVRNAIINNHILSSNKLKSYYVPDIDITQQSKIAGYGIDSRPLEEKCAIVPSSASESEDDILVPVKKQTRKRGTHDVIRHNRKDMYIDIFDSGSESNYSITTNEEGDIFVTRKPLTVKRSKRIKDYGRKRKLRRAIPKQTYLEMQHSDSDESENGLSSAGSDTEIMSAKRRILMSTDVQTVRVLLRPIPQDVLQRWSIVLK